MRNILRFRLVAILLVAVGLFAGGFNAASAQDDGTPVTGSGVVTFAVFYSENITTPVATVSDPINTAAEELDTTTVPAAGITLTIYADGDFTSDPVQVLVTNDGGTAVSDPLPAGDYAVLEASTNNFFPFTVGGENATTTVTILLPVADGTPVPADDDGAADDGAADDGAAADGTVTKLPNTGQGAEDSNGSTIVLLLGVMSMVALAAGFAWRQRRAS